jgi:hypothetical protein
MSANNPFWILEVPVDATPGELEREGRKILGLFGVGAASAKTYTCPLGTFDRDETMVREAMAHLRDPKRRSRAACLARLVGTPCDVEEWDAPLVDAFSIADYRGL